MNNVYKDKTEHELYDMIGPDMKIVDRLLYAHKQMGCPYVTRRYVNNWSWSMTVMEPDSIHIDDLKKHAEALKARGTENA